MGRGAWGICPGVGAGAGAGAVPAVVGMSMICLEDTQCPCPVPRPPPDCDVPIFSAPGAGLLGCWVPCCSSPHRRPVVGLQKCTVTFSISPRLDHRPRPGERIYPPAHQPTSPVHPGGQPVQPVHLITATQLTQHSTAQHSTAQHTSSLVMRLGKTYWTELDCPGGLHCTVQRLPPVVSVMSYRQFTDSTGRFPEKTSSFGYICN